MAYIKIESIVEYARGTKEVWMKTTTPIPEGAAAYAIDTKDVVVGDGVSLYKDLTPLFSFNDIGELEEFLRCFTPVDSTGKDKNKYVTVDSRHKRFIYKYTSDDFVPKTRAEADIEGLADDTHNHDNRYMTKAEIIKLRNAQTATLSESDELAISYLAMKELEYRDLTSQTLPNGQVVLLKSIANVDAATTTALPLTTGGFRLLPNDAHTLQLNSYVSNDEIGVAYVCVREVSLPLVDSKRLLIEASRDNGNTWTGATSVTVIDSGKYNYWYALIGFNNALTPDGHITQPIAQTTGNMLKVRVRTLTDEFVLDGIRTKVEKEERPNADKIRKAIYETIDVPPVIQKETKVVPAVTAIQEVTHYYAVKHEKDKIIYKVTSTDGTVKTFEDKIEADKWKDIVNGTLTKEKIKGKKVDVEISEKQYIEYKASGEFEVKTKVIKEEVVITPEYTEEVDVVVQGGYTTTQIVGYDWLLPQEGNVPVYTFIQRQ